MQLHGYTECTVYEHTCVIFLKATEAYPPVIVVLAKRMGMKSGGSNRAAVLCADMPASRHIALAGKLHHISPGIFWRRKTVSLQHTHQSQPDLRCHHSASCLCVCVCSCERKAEDRRVRHVCKSVCVFACVCLYVFA